MKIQSLAGVAISELTAVFNLAFSDYVIPFHLSEEQLDEKIRQENIQPDYSAGVYADGKLVGFILIGTDNRHKETIAYNAGTGVIPDYRGRQLTEKMYAYLVPLLAGKNIRTHVLEVITANEKAAHVYEKIGFKKLRTLNCFKGKVAQLMEKPAVTIGSIAFPEENVIRLFRNHEPAYQNSFGTLRRAEDSHTCLGTFSEGNLVGYVIFSKSNYRIKQFAVAPEFRRKNIGHSLFYAVQQAAGNKIISLINIDSTDESSNNFLQHIGLELSIRQYEMMKSE